MDISRRRLLAGGGAVLAGLAGCSSLAGEDSPSNDSANGAGGTGSDGDALELDFGEGAEFTNDAGVTLQVGMADPRLVETVPVVRDNEIAVDSPESRPYFLFVRVRVANEGSSSIEPPRGLFFTADGQEVKRSFVRTPGQKYRDIGELSPGESAEATIAFPSPDGSGTGNVALRFQTLLKSPPARWTFDFADLPRESTDLTNDGLGDPFTIDTGGYAYEFTPTAARETATYADGDGTEYTAPSGSKFVLVEAKAENIGEEPVKLPTPYDVRLEADGSISRGTEYGIPEKRYEGQVNPYQPGESQAGVLLFEVPESAANYTLRLAIGNETFVTWPVETSSD
ncbi:hypothetical protein SVXHr_1997 [Halorhabdus sp. SVX81]|uniref:DUF4352 domain-containing protein n=1 Tax=Halorhabdus sp. SVX81 TaxID=2978283 RepID=UPI0023DC1BA9|nr:DUF4352 domain-containing protein [Halorhabdus sp. SVX81]WEL18158.1 hypothetical protein SVXHr_1997 [Halorhabdus sp. SVX81]